MPGNGGSLPSGSGGGWTTAGYGRLAAVRVLPDGEDANNSEDCARVAVENSLYDFWRETLPAQTGAQFRPAKQIMTFTDAVDTGCGGATAEVGPFYCPVDETIYQDTTFFDEVLEKQLAGPSGAFVEPYVLAHEYGHHIQNVLGFMGKVKTQQGPKSDAVRLELQADCLPACGPAASTTDDTTGEVLFAELNDTDIEQAIAAATAVGDDRIQQQSGGRVNPEGGPTGRRPSG